MANGKKNPIELRLDLLHDQWTEFAKRPDVRLLRWLIAPTEASMIGAFLDLEATEEAKDTPDMFLRFDVPFDHTGAYGIDVLRALLEDFTRDKQGMAEEELPTDWRCPVPRPEDSDISALLNAASSFRNWVGEPVEILALVLTPSTVSDVDAWQGWLQRAAHEAPAEVRLVVLDQASAPLLTALAELEPERVVSREADLDMAGALSEISEEAGHLDTPGGRFRHLNVALTNAIAAGDIASAESLGKDALDIAHANRWYHLAVTVHFELGAAYVANDRLLDAAREYQVAEEAAAEGEAIEEPYGPSLRVHSRLAFASVLVAGAEWSAAAAHYRETAPLAARGGDVRMELESWRMASYCHEQAGEFDAGLEDGLAALRVAETMEVDVRDSSTLPYLGEGLLRLAEHHPDPGFGRQVDAAMAALLDEQWRERAMSEATAA